MSLLIDYGIWIGSAASLLGAIVAWRIAKAKEASDPSDRSP